VSSHETTQTSNKSSTELRKAHRRAKAAWTRPTSNVASPSPFGQDLILCKRLGHSRSSVAATPLMAQPGTPEPTVGPLRPLKKFRSRVAIDEVLSARAILAGSPHLRLETTESSCANDAFVSRGSIPAEASDTGPLQRTIGVSMQPDRLLAFTDPLVVD
jgi:hypothetical protein